MPACSSEICNSETGYRSSSPPNSRSASASPPLSWPGVVPGGSSPLSVSPSNTTFKRSISNLSNSSILHLNGNNSDQSNLNYGATIADEGAHGISATAPSVNAHYRHYFTIDLEQEEDTNVPRHLANSTTKRILRKKPQRQSEIVRVEKIVNVPKNWFFPARIVVWYTNLVLRIFRRFYESLNYLIWAPIIWISAWICVFWVIMQLPLNLINWFIRVLFTPAYERARSKRCVLISGGSTLQALHLARNFYKAGARVIVCEIDGLFGLARFSTACSRFYNVPRPGPGTAAEYVNALKTIVEREKVVYFIPVSSTSGAYYDALAKPHLEIIGCECFIPGPADVLNLEDPLKLFQRCSSLGLATPTHRVVRSFDDLARLYEIGSLGINERHVMISAGPAGMTERAKIQLPTCTSIDNAVPRNLRRKLEHHEISDGKPWIVLRESTGGAATRGYQLVTCTTVKDSRVVANVSCRLDETRGLIPEERNDVNQWLETFFARPFSTKINGHLSFKLALEADESLGGLVPISCRVGVSPPYLCLTSVHPRLVWRPCKHFSRHNSANLLVNERYKKTLPLMNLSSASHDNNFAASTRTSNATRINDRGAIGDHFVIPSSAVLDKREVLFVYWDPLPYCAYYHLQFPFRRLAGVIRERPAQHKPPLAVVQ